MTVKAGILITGTEIVCGRVVDRNGPWISERLKELGVDVSAILVCNDRVDEITGALRFFRDRGLGLVVTSGGLGPTKDDITVQTIADFAELKLEHDPELAQRIDDRLKPFADRWNLDRSALKAATDKQALVPQGADVIDPVGTAPGFVLQASGMTVVVLPGPPRELQEIWSRAVDTQTFKLAVRVVDRPRERIIRLFGIPESELAETQRIIESTHDLSSVEITTCMRRAELEVVLRYRPSDEKAVESALETVQRRHRRHIFSSDGSTVDELVANLLGGHSIAVGESCTAGMVAARLTDRPGSSAYFKGGIVAYSNEAKAALLNVPQEILAKYGAVSAQAAEAMAFGAIERFGAEVGVGVTGIAGPGGGSEEKPVGRVCVSVQRAGGSGLTREADLPGDRRDVRERATAVAMHMLRMCLSQRTR